MLPSKLMEALVCADWMIQDNLSVRDISEKTGLSKSTVHNRITKDLKFVNFDKYKQCVDILKTHRKEPSRDRTGKFARPVKKYI